MSQKHITVTLPEPYFKRSALWQKSVQKRKWQCIGHTLRKDDNYIPRMPSNGIHLLKKDVELVAFEKFLKLNSQGGIVEISE